MDCTINLWGAVEVFGGVGRSLLELNKIKEFT